jgi:hypothetical protein
MRFVLRMLLVGGVAIAVTGCGGGGTNEVDGCAIEPSTVCQDADFTDADLSGEDLTGANLTGSNFTDTDLSDANLTEANLSDSQIVDANLDDANLTRTNLRGATIEDTDLTGATRCGTIRTDGTTDDTDCPASGGGGGSTTTATTTATTSANANLPTIVSFTGPATVACPQGRQQVTVNLSWSTRNATELAWQVDGQTIDGPSEPSGSGPFAFACDDPQHTYTLKASNDKGQFANYSATVQRG